MMYALSGMAGFGVIRLLLGVVLVAGFGVSVLAVDLGRLFMTPEERSILDKIRREGPPTVIEEVRQEPEISPEPTVIPSVTVNGVVTRSDGSNTAWINGVSTMDGDLESQYVQVQPGGIRGNRVTVIISDETARHVDLKPGQSYDPVSAKTSDLYQTTEPLQ